MDEDRRKNIIKITDKKIEFLKQQNKDLTNSFAQLTIKATQYKARFRRTPSIWPLHGSYRGGFGWRMHPILGRMEFHKGIDISSYIGAPIYVVADGLVKLSEWQGGYGITVIVDHGYGYQTIYAHLSRTYVFPGERVTKGQKIAAVGSTGLSTGPHLHYEVRRWNEAINPHPYLNLDLFTAIKKIW